MSLNNIFDAHAHYDDKWFDEDRETLLSDIHQRGVRYILNNAVDKKTMEFADSLTQRFDFIYAAAGFHPQNLDDLPTDYLSIVSDYLKKDKFVAIGEIGLDYHWDIEKEPQKTVFEQQLILSKELDMPVVVHDREAHGDVLIYLKKYRPKGIVHCFSGSVEMLKEVMRHGMSISLGGVVTYKNARVPVEVAKAVPVDRLLLETDAPYLSPVPNRGKRNDSSNIVYTAERIAQIKNMDTQELIDITTENAIRMFSI